GCSVLTTLPRPPPTTILLPYTTLFRSCRDCGPDSSTVFDHQHIIFDGENAALLENRERLLPIAHDHPHHRMVHGVGNGQCENVRSEEHTSELQSRVDLVCRLLLEK